MIRIVLPVIRPNQLVGTEEFHFFEATPVGILSRKVVKD